MKKIAVIFILFGSAVMAQTDTTKLWNTGGVMGLNFSQVALKNWVGGGENSISSNALVNIFANYKKNKTTWDNTIDLGYGLSRIGDEAKFIKNDDKIDLTSKFGHHAFGDHWYYSGLVNFKTQFTAGYNYPNDSVKISEFLTPAYTLIALGMDYKLKKFSAFIAPLTGKITTVNSQRLADMGAFGVAPAEYDAQGNMTKEGDRVRKELGGFVKIMFKSDIIENVNFQTKVELFSNYLNNPKNIDVNWESLLSMKVNKYISANVTFALVYDDDIKIAVDNNEDGITDSNGPRVQYKEVLGIGLSYKF